LIAKSERLTVLSEAEQYALYGLPDFDDAQRLDYLALTETELSLAVSRPGLHAQVYCVLQIGYFKAKHAFFRFDWSEVEDDCAFVLSRYFNGEVFERKKSPIVGKVVESKPEVVWKLICERKLLLPKTSSITSLT